ncbi:MAG: response regulator transcription factor [Gemmobacter sp.]
MAVASKGLAAAPRVRVLVAKGATAQRDVLIQNLVAEGFAVETAQSGDEVLLHAVKAAPDIIVLGRDLPALSGLEVCRHLKAHPVLRRIPIILVAPSGDAVDRIAIEEAGADDHVEQPYSVVDLMARLRLQLFRARPDADGETHEFEDIVLDGERYRVFRAGTPIHLGPVEFRLLAALIERPGRVWTREQLLERVWAQPIYVSTRTVDVNIGRLRRALGQHDSDHPVRTVRGVGYALG